MFRPEGRLLCCLNENSSAVTSLAVSEDTHFFASGSSDGTIKIWDLKGQRNYTNLKSSDTIVVGSQDVKIRNVLFIENTVVGSIEDGRLAFIDAEKGATTYTQTSSTPTCMNFINQNTFAYTTKEGMLNTWDMRAKNVASSFSFGPQRGIVLSMCYDTPAMYCGTATGYFLMYDMRFNIMYRSLLHSKKSPIHSLA
jgi:WD40 repeat protein